MFRGSGRSRPVVDYVAGNRDGFAWQVIVTVPGFA
jgi:hypothetical protein